ncbi:hypothetical protein CPB86DRAFT_483442 [Serendipita vermifera]|nr:hypothetical protein CPB86DRAFT_483442 [Serendipita vermifera]
MVTGSKKTLCATIEVVAIVQAGRWINLFSVWLWLLTFTHLFPASSIHNMSDEIELSRHAGGSGGI